MIRKHGGQQQQQLPNTLLHSRRVRGEKAGAPTGEGEENQVKEKVY